MTDQRHARLRRFGGDALQPSHPLARKRADLQGDVLRDRRDGVVLLDIDAHHARRLGGAISARETACRGRSAPHRRSCPGRASRAVRSIPSIVLTTSILPREDGEQRALSAFVNGEFSGAEVEVGGRAGEPLQLGGRQARRTSGTAATSSIVSMVWSSGYSARARHATRATSPGAGAPQSHNARHGGEPAPTAVRRMARAMPTPASTMLPYCATVSPRWRTSAPGSSVCRTKSKRKRAGAYRSARTATLVPGGRGGERGRPRRAPGPRPCTEIRRDRGRGAGRSGSGPRAELARSPDVVVHQRAAETPNTHPMTSACTRPSAVSSHERPERQ